MLPRLVIQQTHGALAIESKRAQLTPARSQMKMNVSAQRAKFEANTSLPRVQIDQTEAFASAGLKPALRVSGDIYKEALNKGIETIGRIASEGQAFLRIENRGNPVVDVAKQSMEVSTSMSVTAMPSVPPEINFTGGDFQLNWQPGMMSIEWEAIESLPFEYVPAEINISWYQRPHIEISVEPGSELRFPVNSGVGRLVDEAT